ncbi:MAG: DUF4292 domain-containing protein [Flavobacteriales bacterium]
MKNYYLFIVVVFFLNACGTTKIATGTSKANSNLSINSIVATHLAAQPNFKTLAARVQVLYENEQKSQSITVSLRMEKNKTIWIKASILGITLAKVIITPNKVSYYETINKTYFDGDFSLISNWLGTPLDFEKIQNLLLGQSIFAINHKTYQNSIYQNNYKIEPIKQDLNYIHFLLLYPENFKVAFESLSQPNENRLLTLNYTNYKKIEGAFYPFHIHVIAKEKNKNTNIELLYKKIDHNAPVRFPFKLPEGYQQVELH